MWKFAISPHKTIRLVRRLARERSIGIKFYKPDFFESFLMRKFGPRQRFNWVARYVYTPKSHEILISPKVRPSEYPLALYHEMMEYFWRPKTPYERAISKMLGVGHHHPMVPTLEWNVFASFPMSAKKQYMRELGVQSLVDVAFETIFTPSKAYRIFEREVPIREFIIRTGGTQKIPKALRRRMKREMRAAAKLLKDEFAAVGIYL